MKPLNQALEDGNYLIFLKEVRNITHRRFVMTNKRSRILHKLTEEIHNLEKTKKNNLPEPEEIILMNKNLFEAKNNNLQIALGELQQCEKELETHEQEWEQWAQCEQEISKLSQEQFELELQEINNILNS